MSERLFKDMSDRMLMSERIGQSLICDARYYFLFFARRWREPLTSALKFDLRAVSKHFNKLMKFVRFDRSLSSGRWFLDVELFITARLIYSFYTLFAEGRRGPTGNLVWHCSV